MKLQDIPGLLPRLLYFCPTFLQRIEIEFSLFSYKGFLDSLWTLQMIYSIPHTHRSTHTHTEYNSPSYSSSLLASLFRALGSMAIKTVYQEWDKCNPNNRFRYLFNIDTYMWALKYPAPSCFELCISGKLPGQIRICP